ncbi:MAG: hypothetical protein ACI90V_004359, partial [Bacillariaceae sp.]|jgi:hypothetical protein
VVVGDTKYTQGTSERPTKEEERVRESRNIVVERVFIFFLLVTSQK